MGKGKLFIISAPSGSGKSTIINYLLTQDLNMAFSVSATSRNPRGDEQHGEHYYFMTPNEFRSCIKHNEFIEYEEVYENHFYGTLKEPIERLINEGKNVIFDVDVVGGVNLKKYFGQRALAIFIQPPSIEELRTRLTGRGTDNAEAIEKRIAKVEFELSYAGNFDVVVVNDDLVKAKEETLRIVKNFIAGN